MADTVRKTLVWDIRKGLFSLSAEQLFQVASNVSGGSDRDSSELSSGDAEGCFEHISSFMYSKTLLEAEDSGMGELLALKDIVDDLLQASSSQMDGVETRGKTTQAHASSLSQENPGLEYVQPPADGSNTRVSLSQDEMFKIISDYDAINKTLQGLVVNPPVSLPHGLNSQQDNVRSPTHPVVSFRDLPYLPRREFKVQGGQIGDYMSDISYHSICRQIEEGQKENFTESEIVRGVLKIIKPGDFKDMLINMDDMTVGELKGFLLSHLGERNSTELFQELICAKQKENETAQQFLYRVIGLKQKILFASKKSGSEIKYSAETVQGVFLHTVYQGIGHKDSDIRRELKPLLADQAVTDETILKHVRKVTSEESERHRRLGSTRQKHVSAHAAQVEELKTTPPKKDTKDQKPKTDIVKDLAEKIDSLTKMVESLTETVYRERSSHMTKTPVTRSERLYVCAKCAQAGSQSCNHCFSCGIEGHRAIGCLERPKKQGNESRLLQGDRQ